MHAGVFSQRQAFRTAARQLSVPHRHRASTSRQPVVAAATVQSPTAVNSSANGSSGGGGTRVMIIGAGRDWLEAQHMLSLGAHAHKHFAMLNIITTVTGSRRGHTLRTALAHI